MEVEPACRPVSASLGVDRYLLSWARYSSSTRISGSSPSRRDSTSQRGARPPAIRLKICLSLLLVVVLDVLPQLLRSEEHSKGMVHKRRGPVADGTDAEAGGGVLPCGLRLAAGGDSLPCSSNPTWRSSCSHSQCLQWVAAGRASASASAAGSSAGRPLQACGAAAPVGDTLLTGGRRDDHHCSHVGAGPLEDGVVDEAAESRLWRQAAGHPRRLRHGVWHGESRATRGVKRAWPDSASTEGTLGWQRESKCTCWLRS